MKSKPDDRRDNVEKLQQNINSTIRNMELANETIAKTDDPKAKKDLRDKNCRREAALNAQRNEIKDEAEYQAKK